MAVSNKNIQLKRYNGTDWDNLFPKTNVNNIEGLLSSEDNKINSSLLPSYILGSLRYKGIVEYGGSATTTITDIYSVKLGLATPTETNKTNELYKGYFLISPDVGTITGFNTVVSNVKHVCEYGEEDEGSTKTSYKLESADWIVYRGSNIISGVTYHYWDIINNTYQDASTSAKGVVKLIDSIASGNTTNAPTPNAVYNFVSNGYADKGSAISSLSVSERTITFTKANGGTGTITTQDTVYTHPSYTANASGLYKFSNDNKGHITGVTSVAKADITALGIPAQDTTYTAGTGLTLSGTQFSINNSITAGSKGLTDDSAPSFGGTFKVPYITYNANGLITATNEYSVQLPSTTASASANGLMTSTNYKSLTNLCRSVISANPTSATTGDICVVEIS